ncbi:hypothetical protein B7486_41485 [cyanobacterium TDX16]|nr:hypothetical protein B7486_41485 [cyanobacterium TDX16]
MLHSLECLVCKPLPLVCWKPYKSFIAFVVCFLGIGIIGQLLPTILAVPLTFLFGRKRSLKAGKANVNNSEQMPIPEDLLQILES